MPITILAVGAHMDDVEIAIGGILYQAVKAGHRFVAVVTASDYSTWKSTAGHEEECKCAQFDLARRFGYEKRFLDYPYHQFPADLAAKRKLAEIYIELQPGITFVHHTDDLWPDHVSAGIAAKDAVLFAHGYTAERTIRRCPRVFAFSISPSQTYNFEPDFFVRIDDVMPDYMELLVGIDCCLPGQTREKAIRYETKDLRTGAVLPLTSYGFLKQAQCAA
jgi:LmbE family N-acetylglucosaminyl deacetylase